MLKTSLTAIFTGLLLCAPTCAAELTKVPVLKTGAAQPVKPEALLEIGEGSYCYAVDRQLRPDRNPPPRLVMQLRLKVTYRNPGQRPMIIPVEHTRTVYTSLAPGVMKPFKESLDLFGPPSVKIMKNLPADVSVESPVVPENDTFAVIPAGGKLRPLEEDVTLPLYKKGLHQTDLAGHRLYMRLQLNHQELAPELEAVLSDKWARFGVPWTGAVRTNTLVIDIPAAPKAAECIDKPDK